jgi:hypothetical protein
MRRVQLVLAVAALSTASCSLLVDTDRFNAGGPLATVDSGGALDAGDDAIEETATDGSMSETATDAPAEGGAEVGATVSGHLYVVGGTTPPSSQHDDFRAADVKSDGSLGAFSTLVKLPSHAAGTVAVVSGEYVYVLGGDIFAGTDRTARFAKLTAGVPGACQTTNPLPDQRIRHAAAATDGYVYVMGGQVGPTTIETVFFAPILSGGFLGDWVATASLPQARNGPCAARWKDNLYVAGGSDLDTVYRAHVNGDGTLAAWVPEGKLSSGATAAGCAVYGDRLYVVGGYGHFTTAESGALSATGSILGWTKVTLEHPHAFFGLAVSGKWMYAFGGFDTTGDSSTDTVEVAELTADGFAGNFKVNSHLIEPRFFVTGFGTP